MLMFLLEGLGWNPGLRACSVSTLSLSYSASSLWWLWNTRAALTLRMDLMSGSPGLVSLTPIEDRHA